MRKFPREYMEKYPSARKVYDAIAGPRRLGSERTAENYINYIAIFVDYLGVSDPEAALRAMREGKIDATEKVDRFIDYALEELGRSHNSVRGYVFAAKKWFDLNGIKVEWAKIEMPTGTETRENDRAPTKEELRRLLGHASSARDRAVIYCDTSSGLRINTLLGLRIGDVDLSYPDVARLTVERKRGRKFASKRGPSSGRLFVTFITPEAKAALNQYLEERKNAGELLTPESPLFGDAYHQGKFLTEDAYGRVWCRLLRRAGLDKKSNKWYELHIHTLRKYFRSNCIGVDPSFREKWMGHKGQYLDLSYFRAEEQKHLEEYRKIVNHLTIQEAKTDEGKRRLQQMMDMAKIMGFEEEKIKKLEDILQRAKDPEEAIEGFRRLRDEPYKTKPAENSAKPSPIVNGGPKYAVAKGEKELVKRLDDGWSLVQSLSDDKFLLKQ